jgi:hypothetical protein
MSLTTIVLWLTFLVFSAFTLVVMAQWGVVGFLEAGLANGPTVQVGLDLVIMVTLFALWLVRDARERGLNPWPFVALAFTTGSIGALCYLIWRERASAPARAAAQA